MAPQLDGYFRQVDDLTDHFIDRLRKAVAIPSVSAEEARRPEVVRMGHFLADEPPRPSVRRWSSGSSASSRASPA